MEMLIGKMAYNLGNMLRNQYLCTPIHFFTQ